MKFINRKLSIENKVAVRLQNLYEEKVSEPTKTLKYKWIVKDLGFS